MSPEKKLSFDDSLIASSRHKLKRAGFEKYGGLEAALSAHCEALNSQGNGLVARKRLLSVCALFLLPLTTDFINDIASLCQDAATGLIIFSQFVAMLDPSRTLDSAPPAFVTVAPTRAGGLPTVFAFIFYHTLVHCKRSPEL